MVGPWTLSICRERLDKTQQWSQIASWPKSSLWGRGESESLVNCLWHFSASQRFRRKSWCLASHACTAHKSPFLFMQLFYSEGIPETTAATLWRCCVNYKHRNISGHTQQTLLTAPGAPRAKAVSHKHGHDCVTKVQAGRLEAVIPKTDWKN